MTSEQNMEKDKKIAELEAKICEKDLIIQREINEKTTLKTQVETNEIIYNLKLELASKK